MNKLFEWVQKRVDRILTLPALFLSGQFAWDLVTFMKDGHLDDQEMHQLLASADGIELIIVLLVIAVFRYKRKKDEKKLES